MSRTAFTGLVASFALVALATYSMPSAQAQTLKMGVIDVQRIITDSASGKAALAKLEQWGKEQESKLNVKKDELAALARRIEEGKLSLASDKLADLQKDYENKQIDLRRTSDDAQREFNRRQTEELGAIERRVMPIITQVGQEGGYTVIFRKFDSGLVYAADGIDITAAVITRLDAQPAGATPPGR